MSNRTTTEGNVRARRLALAIAFTLAGGLCLASAATGQLRPARPGELPALDARTRAAVVDSIAAAIDSVYVLEDAAGRIVEHLRGRLAAGAYDSITDPAALVDRLENEAQAVHRDNHFYIVALPPADPAASGQPGPDPREAERERRILRMTNYGFSKVQILQGNVGVLKLNGFVDTALDPAVGEAAAAAMGFLANTDAVIFDLRDNGGGSPSMIRLLAGYLFKESEHLINWDIRVEGRTVQSWSADHVPGRRLDGIPVYVLTSDRTASAAEEFTFDLQHLERATIVGDTTGGAGHTAAQADFDFDGFRVRIRLPLGRAYDPKTGRGWEGVGIIPDIPARTDRALEAAHAHALERLLAAEEDPEARHRMEWALEGLRSEIRPVVLSRDQMRAYLGTYGPRRIFLRDGALWYQREDRPEFRLEPMGEDLFQVGDLEYFRLGFVRDERGRVVKAVGRYIEGRTDENERTGR